MSEKPISDLRHRVLEDMAVRKFGDKTRHDYIRHVETFTAFLGRSPDTATADDVRRYQVHLTGTGAACQVRVPVQAERHHAHLLPTRRRRGECPGRRRHARHRIRPSPKALAITRLTANPFYNAQLRTTCVATSRAGTP
jgi:Phage integrase, N-terminal SAM-like domain